MGMHEDSRPNYLHVKFIFFKVSFTILKNFLFCYVPIKTLFFQS